MTINVTVRNGNLEQAMRVLKRKVQKEGLIKELRERQFYKKPSEIKQEKKKEAIKNWKKKQKKLEKIRGFQSFLRCEVLYILCWLFVSPVA